jgi:hypothetical protein
MHGRCNTGAVNTNNQTGLANQLELAPEWKLSQILQHQLISTSFT